MPLPAPRIPPLEESEWTDEDREALERTRRNGKVKNVFRTFARHPKLFRKFSVLGSHIRHTSTLDPRDRELLILRTGWHCRSEYEFSQHTQIGREAGLSDDDIRRVMEGPEAPGWDSFDATLLQAADELVATSILSDETWNALTERYEAHQLMDVVFTVGQYVMVSMALNSFGVQLEEGDRGFDL